MMRTTKIITTLMVSFVAIFATSCGITSDPETEKKLEGTWITEATEYEDGMRMKIVSKETFSLSGHVYEAQLSMMMTSPVRMDIGTVSYSGTWKAYKEGVECKIDKESLSFTFSNMLDASDKREMKQEIINGLEELDYTEGMRFTSDITDQFTAKDDEDDTVMTYYRVN